MGIYYQTFTAGELQSHETIEDAIAFAEANNCSTIEEIGGSWDEYEQCAFCGEWFPVTELNTQNECVRCEIAIKYHG